MANTRQIRTLEDIATDALIKHGIFSVEVPKSASSNYQKLASLLEQVIHKRLLPIFLQAIIDDDRKKVIELLDKNPELLLVKALKSTEIQSQYTWLKIDVENEDALSIAVKRKQIEMIKLLLPYYDKLEQTKELIQVKHDTLSAWKIYPTQKNENNEDEIIIDPEYIAYAQLLIDVFKKETFPNGAKEKFSEETEMALSLLFNLLLPKKAVKLNDYIDPELFLLALYQTSHNNSPEPSSWQRSKFKDGFNDNSRDAFQVRIIGLAQSIASPETAKILCEGIYFVVEKNYEISESANALELRCGKPFYRSSSESRSGLGFEYVVGELHADWVNPYACEKHCRGDVPTAKYHAMLYNDFMLRKNHTFMDLKKSAMYLPTYEITRFAKIAKFAAMTQKIAPAMRLSLPGSF